MTSLDKEYRGYDATGSKAVTETATCRFTSKEHSIEIEAYEDSNIRFFINKYGIGNSLYIRMEKDTPVEKVDELTALLNKYAKGLHFLVFE